MKKITLITLISTILLMSCTDINNSSIITIDTHIDINVENFTDSLNYTMNTDTQFNLPNMSEGGLDVAWLVVYTAQGELNEEGYKAAYNNAKENLKKKSAEELSKITGGLNLPLDFKLPFLSMSQDPYGT